MSKPYTKGYSQVARSHADVVGGKRSNVTAHVSKPKHSSHIFVPDGGRKTSHRPLPRADQIRSFGGQRVRSSHQSRAMVHAADEEPQELQLPARKSAFNVTKFILLGLRWLVIVLFFFLLLMMILVWVALVFHDAPLSTSLLNLLGRPPIRESHKHSNVHRDRRLPPAAASPEWMSPPPSTPSLPPRTHSSAPSMPPRAPMPLPPPPSPLPRTPPMGCASWCEGHPMSWAMKCAFQTCGACSACTTPRSPPKAPWPPSPPPPSPSPASPPPPPPRKEGSEVKTAINARFRRPPYDATWDTEGTLADSGVLVHVFDGWENGFTPNLNRHQMSSSFIYSSQRPPHCHDSRRDCPIPVYRAWAVGVQGIVLRPGTTTRIVCGTSFDSSDGECREWCPSVPFEQRNEYDPRSSDVGPVGSQVRPGGCDGSWRPLDFGVFLYRMNRYEQEWSARAKRTMDYSEIVLDSAHWTNHLPDVIEAFFETDDHGKANSPDPERRDVAKLQHARFLQQYKLSSNQVPLLRFDRTNWQNPFR